ncbi:MAG: hypothetical protein SFV32_01105 [Opitutaceae bacterium]|nr:hypothetical protein [Opitutaceae bacterium]
MKLLFAKSMWEASHLALSQFLSLVRDEGYDATELYLPGRTETSDELRALHEGKGLQLLAQASTSGHTLAEHLESLETWYRKGVAAKAIAVNFHTGSDCFSIADNTALFRRAVQLEQECGVPLLHETHRGRALFSATGTCSYLEAVPGMRLTLDLSHWFCVHESDLTNQEENLTAAIRASHHVHARVGHSEGPQLPAPHHASAKGWLERHEALWERVIAARKEEGAAFLTFTPEWGPPPYMPVDPTTGEAVANAWDVNRWMHARLLDRFGRFP